MSLKELYEWAVGQHIEDYDVMLDENWDGLRPVYEYNIEVDHSRREIVLL